MAIVTRQITANATTATFLYTVPNGECSVVLSNAGNANVLIGGVNLSQTNGVVLPPDTTVSFVAWPSSKGRDLYALVATGGATQPVSILVSTTD